MKAANKRIILTILFLFTAVGLHAQVSEPPPGFEDMDLNPYLIEGVVEPAPLLPLEFNGTGNLRFDVGNTGSDDIVWVQDQAMGMVITLSKGVPDVTDPSDPADALNALSGPGVAWFDWTYDVATTTFTASQIATIPANSRERINIAYRVSENSFLAASPTTSNGFNVNIQPPDWTNPQPTDDDAVSSFTFVEAFDFGDVPDSYGTPRHVINVTKNSNGLYNQYVYLGVVLDPEDGPQHSPNADGDNVNETGGLGVDDEDGVVFPLMTPGTTVDVPVTFTVWDYDPFENAPGIRIRGWIDWDKDGVFATSGIEAAIDDNGIGTFLENESPWTGPRDFTRIMQVAIPADATGSYFMRLRIGPNTNPTTDASSYGEIEDHTFETSSVATIELTQGPCWRTLTSPIAGETYQQFFARFRTNDIDYGGLWTQGAGITGSRAPFGGANVFTLNATGSEWVAVSDLTQTIPAGTGILMTVFDEDEFENINSAGFPKTAVFADTETQNASPVTVTLGAVAGTTASGGDNDPNFQGFSMLGNPYKTTIDFDQLTRSDVQQIAWIYDRGTGQWISWNGDSGDITNGLIAPGQGFVVQNVATPAGTPSVIFPEAAKAVGGTFVGKDQDRPDFIRLEIEGEELTSSMWLEFSEAGSFTKTTGDVIQLMSFESDYSVLSSLKEGQMYDIGRFPSAHGELQIPVIAEVTRAGTYTIRATDMMLPAGAELYLHDLQTGDRELITEDMEYRFTINQSAKSPENGCFAAPQKAKASADNRFMVTTASGMENPGTLPSEFRLNQNYPNPFNPSTQISYQLPQQSDVRLEVFDMSGRQVAMLVNESVNAGTHTVSFNATNLSSGVYMYRLQAGRTVLTKKLTLIK